MPCRAPDRINFLDGSLAYRKNDISSKLLAETRSSISIGVVNKICRDKLSYNDLIIYIYKAGNTADTANSSDHLEQVKRPAGPVSVYIYRYI